MPQDNKSLPAANAEKLKEDLKRDLSRLIEDSLEKAQGQSQKTYQEAKEQLQEKYQAAKEQAAQKRAEFDQYIKDNPEKSLLITAGIGALLGMFLALLVKALGNNR
jgi:ElaB/YqjD/DUF883 family membrane-anchored ribosome-binding protein